MGMMSDAKNGVSIRRATLEDYAAITAVWSASGMRASPRGRDRRDAFARQLELFQDFYLVAVDGERVVGVILGTHDRRKGWINHLAVLPGYQRRGIAAALVNRCDRALRDIGIGIVAALVESENDVSANLFKKLGYLEDVPVRYFRKLDHPEV